MAKANQKQSNGSALNFDTQLCKVIDDAMSAIERENPSIKGVLPRDYARSKADLILANPPFNMSDCRGENLRQDVHWKFGMPPVNNANYGWIQHFIHHLSPVGVAGFVLANGSMSTQTSGEGEIRKALIEADLVDCMVALPGQLFFTTQIPVCLWFLARDKKNHKRRDRRGETLFIDARKMGVVIDRIHRELTIEEIAKISDCYPIPMSRYEEAARKLGWDEEKKRLELPSYVGSYEILPAWTRSLAGLRRPFNQRHVLDYWRTGKEMILEEMPDFHLRPEWQKYLDDRNYQHGAKAGAVQHAIFKDILSALKTIAGSHHRRPAAKPVTK